MRYAFIERHKTIWPICEQCRVLRVSVCGYHQYVRRRKQIAQRRHLSDEALLVHIRAVFAAHGAPMAGRGSGGSCSVKASMSVSNGCSS